MRAVTLIELIVVVIIIGILAGIATPMYLASQERALNREAQANLRLIRAGERIYRMEHDTYIACANNAAINTNLKLDLSVGSPTWNYKVDGVAAATFVGKARRNGGNLRVWCINQVSEDPFSGCTW